MYLSMTNLVILLVCIGILFYTTMWFRARAHRALKLLFDGVEHINGLTTHINELKGMVLEKSVELCALKQYSSPPAEVKEVDISHM